MDPKTKHVTFSDIINAIKVAILIIIVISVFVFGFTAYHYVKNLENKAKETLILKEKYNVVKEQLSSAWSVSKKLKEENKELYKGLKNANAKIKRLTTITIKQKKEIAKITNLPTPVPTENGKKKVSFSKDFGYVLIDGIFEAKEIIGPSMVTLKATRKQETITVVNTDHGTITTSTNPETEIAVNTTKTKQPFLHNFSVRLGFGTSSTLSVDTYIGVAYKKWEIGYETSAKRYWFTKRFSLGK